VKKALVEIKFGIFLILEKKKKKKKNNNNRWKGFMGRKMLRITA